MKNSYRYIIGAIVAAIALFLVWYFSKVVSYILISAVLGIVGRPIVRFLSKIKIRRFKINITLASAITLLSFWIFAVLFASIFLPLVFGKLNQMSGLDMNQITDSLRQPIGTFELWLKRMFGSSAEFSVADSISSQLKNLFDIKQINIIFSSTVTVVADLFMGAFSISFITFFFLKEEDLFTDIIAALFPSKYHQNIRHALDSVSTLLMRYFSGIIIESSSLMIIVGMSFMLWGFDPSTAFLMGLLVGILNVIPYVGSIISSTLCIVIGLISPLDGMTFADMIFIVAGTILIIKGIDDFIIQPMVYSNRVNAHPLEIFIVILLAGSIGGILGMLLAIPAYNVIRVFAKEFFNNFTLVQKLTSKI